MRLLGVVVDLLQGYNSDETFRGSRRLATSPFLINNPFK